MKVWILIVGQTRNALTVTNAVISETEQLDHLVFPFPTLGDIMQQDASHSFVAPSWYIPSA